jgi:hypothetical protein
VTNINLACCCAGQIPDKKFSLRVRRSTLLSEVLDSLKKQGLHINRQGKIVRIRKLIIDRLLSLLKPNCILALWKAMTMVQQESFVLHSSMMNSICGFPGPANFAGN